jgi:two-component system response regulator AlgR
MKILVVDDEPPARARLKALVNELQAGEVIGEAGHGAAAIEIVERTGADVVLMDIRMPGMDGLEAARHLSAMEHAPAVIFTTAYDSHALEAFEANAVDYLLKPIRRDRLQAALVKARNLTRSQAVKLSAALGVRGVRTHVSATLNGNLKLVPVTQVCFFRAEHKYVTARFADGELVLDESLSALEEEFKGGFLRVHRNALVAVAHVRALERDEDGRPCVRCAGVPEGVEVSRRMLSQVRKALRAVQSS